MMVMCHWGYLKSFVADKYWHNIRHERAHALTFLNEFTNGVQNFFKLCLFLSINIWIYHLFIYQTFKIQIENKKNNHLMYVLVARIFW